MAAKRGASSDPPPGLNWKHVGYSLRKNEDLNTVVCSTFQSRPWELWSYLNWLELLDKKSAIKKKDYDELVEASELYIQKRLLGDDSMPRAELMFPPASRTPAPRKSSDMEAPRSIEYDQVTWTPKIKIMGKYPNLCTTDVWGSERGAAYVPVSRPKGFPERDLEKIRAMLKAIRDNMFMMAKNHGMSTESLIRLQEFRRKCNIWNARTTSFAYSNIVDDVVLLLEHIDVYQWEILALIRILPNHALNKKWKKHDKANCWFPRGGLTFIHLPTKDPADASKTKIAAVRVEDYDPSEDEKRENYDTTTCPFRDPEPGTTLVILSGAGETPHNAGMPVKPPPDLPAQDPAVDITASAAAATGTTIPVSEELADWYSQFHHLVEIAPLNPQMGQALGAIPVTAMGMIRGNMDAPGTYGIGSLNDYEEEESEEEQITTSDGTVLTIRQKRDRGGQSSLFSAKDLGARIPKVNMQKSDAADLFRFGKAVQRYAINPNCHAGVLLDTIVTQGEPNERNLKWLQKIFHNRATMKERSQFFTKYRDMVLPSFSLAKLSEFALKYRLLKASHHPARVIGGDYSDYMRPYLYLAKSMTDKRQVEQLMRQRFSQFLGAQLRMSLESSMLQMGVDPFKLSLDDLVDALKNYGNRLGYEVYANPDKEDDYAVMGVYVQNPDMPRDKSSILAARDVHSDESSSTSESDSSSSDDQEKKPKKRGPKRVTFKSVGKQTKTKSKRSKSPPDHSDDDDDDGPPASLAAVSSRPSALKPTVVTSESSAGEESDAPSTSSESVACAHGKTPTTAESKPAAGAGKDQKNNNNKNRNRNRGLISPAVMEKSITNYLNTIGASINLTPQSTKPAWAQNPAFNLVGGTQGYRNPSRNRGRGRGGGRGRGRGRGQPGGNGQQQGQPQQPGQTDQGGQQKQISLAPAGHPYRGTNYRPNYEAEKKARGGGKAGQTYAKPNQVPPTAAPNFPPPLTMAALANQAVCWLCQNPGHLQGSCPYFATAYNPTAPPKVCSVCLGTGHWKHECPVAAQAKGNQTSPSC